MPIRHVYLHVPFCPTICPFCSFHVVERRSAAVEAYLDRLEHELTQVAAVWPVEPATVYVGGGTPSYLRLGEMERLCSMVTDRIGWASVEATLEVHPATATPERVRAWTELGFTRLSVGAQSFSDETLRVLGRTHTARDNRRVVQWCLDAGATVGVDLIVAVDGQDLDLELDAVADLGIDHCSAYTLTIEEGTPFDVRGVRVDNTTEAESMVRCRERLADMGLGQYEVSNFARTGAQCHHNRAYWNHDPYVGFGPSAASLVDLGDDSGGLARCANPGLESWLSGATAVIDDHGGRAELPPMEPLEQLLDSMLCGLRMVEGVDISALERRSGADLPVRTRSELDCMVNEGWMVEIAGRTACTDAGRLVLDSLIERLW